MRLPSLTLVIGAAACGKSAIAERMVVASGLAKVYLATSVPRDAVMRARIAAHRKARAGKGWRTVEVPVEVAPALAGLEAEEVALLDSATAWLENVAASGRDWRTEIDALTETARATPGPVVIVSREIGGAMHPAGDETRAWFQSINGQMNQRLAAAADQVIAVTAGLPQVLKSPEF